MICLRFFAQTRHCSGSADSPATPWTRDIVTKPVLYSRPWRSGQNGTTRFTAAPTTQFTPVVSNEEAVMADTRLQAVATADDRWRRASAAIRESVAASAVAGPTGLSGSGARAAAVPSDLSGACVPAAPSVFAHTFQPQRPAFVRAGSAVRSGHPHGRPSRTGLSCGRRARVLGAPGPIVPQAGVAHSLWKVVMGTDRDLSIVAAS